MPQMGVSVAEGTVIAWRVQVGDSIKADDTICEISTDKIDTEVPAPASGVVSEILVGIETTVEVGTVLARIASSEGGPSAAANAGAGNGTAPATVPPQGAAPATVPPQGAAPATVPPQGAAPATVPPRGTVPGTVPRQGTVPAASVSPDRRRYSPVVQRIAAQHGVDLARVGGSGRDGRVRKQDVLAYISSPQPTAAAEAHPEPPLHIESPYRPEPGFDQGGVGLSRMRRQIGEHMKRSLHTAATCTTWIEVDMSRVEAARSRMRLTALPFVARAAVAALREHPSLNAWLEDERYTRHDAGVHLGIAVSLGEGGLIVPVVHNAHELSAEGLAARIRDLAQRARAGMLAPDEVRGGTFTITNPGQYGSIMATPVINQPQVAILDLEAIVKRAVVMTDADGNDSIAIRPITILGCSWDHRALDGALAAQFLASVRRRLETLSSE
jgi:2-oxoglutarate dehydrogenase E2 component (dihydrolipoamide succinyltransferase)